MVLIMRKPALCKCENKGLTGILAKNMCLYMGVRTFGPFKFQKSGQSYTLFFFKKGVYNIPGGAEKRGLFGTHIRTMSYIGYSLPPRF